MKCYRLSVNVKLHMCICYGKLREGLEGLSEQCVVPHFVLFQQPPRVMVNMEPLNAAGQVTDTQNKMGTGRADTFTKSLAVSLARMKVAIGTLFTQDVIDILQDEDFHIRNFKKAICNTDDCTRVHIVISTAVLAQHNLRETQ